jgi:membrane fusion protein, multidrug efflux system
MSVRASAAEESMPRVSNTTPPVMTSLVTPARRAGGARSYIVLTVIAMLAGGGYVGIRTLNANRQTTDDAQVEADVVPVSVRVGGSVRYVKIKDNALVRKGDVILELESADWLARLKQVEGELDAAKAQAAAADAQVKVAEATARGGLSTARAQVSTSMAQVGSADALVAASQAQLLRARADEKRTVADLERTRQLIAASAVSQERLDDAQTTYDSAHASVVVAQAQVISAKDAKRVATSRVAEASGNVDSSNPVDAKIAGARASVDIARARVVTAEAALELARLNLSYVQVRAPSDGTVSRLSVHEGQLLAPSQTIAELVPESSYVVANFKETQVGAMRVGQHVDVEVDAFATRHIEGVVASIAGGTGARFSLLPPDNASGNFVKVVQRVPVRVEWKNVPKDVILRAGMSATATVYTGS